MAIIPESKSLDLNLNWTVSLFLMRNECCCPGSRRNVGMPFEVMCLLNQLSLDVDCYKHSRIILSKKKKKTVKLELLSYLQLLFSTQPSFRNFLWQALGF